MKAFTSTLIVLSAIASSVMAHGRLAEPKPLDTEFHRLSGNNLCGGRVNIANGAPGGPTQLQAGANQKMSWFVLNGDGAGPLQVKIDPTGTGQNFVDATVSKQVVGNNGNIGNTGLKTLTHPIIILQTRAATDFEIVVPNIACTGSNGCLMQVKQNIRNGNGFGTCAFINIAGGNGAAAKNNQNNGQAKNNNQQANNNEQAKKNNQQAKNNGQAKKNNQQANKNGQAKKNNQQAKNNEQAKKNNQQAKNNGQAKKNNQQAKNNEQAKKNNQQANNNEQAKKKQENKSSNNLAAGKSVADAINLLEQAVQLLNTV
ncbi:hypothetical protein HDU67_005037 [Dinochytrium kinnereticum]|nr:hypothetical protein HDU67_005037 [Dinochytrium kinnereticum]